MENPCNNLQRFLTELFYQDTPEHCFPVMNCDAFTQSKIEAGDPLFEGTAEIPDFFVVLNGKITANCNSIDLFFSAGEYFWKEDFLNFDLQSSNFVCLETAEFAYIHKSASETNKLPCSDYVPMVLEFIRLGLNTLKQKQLIINQELQLDVQKKRINELISSRKRYMGILGHDLRSPVASMITLGEIIIDDFDSHAPEDLKSMVQDLSGLAKIHIKMLENLIFWTRLQNDQISFDKDLVECKDFMNKAWEMSKNDHPSKSIRFTNHIAGNIKISADANMLLILFKQILSNAIKFSNSPNEVLAEYTETIDKQLIKIIDRGLGIKGDKLLVLFDPEKHNSTYGTENEMGTGIGLLLCNDIIKLHQWKLEVTSTVGEGTCVLISIPKVA